MQKSNLPVLQSGLDFSDGLALLLWVAEDFLVDNFLVNANIKGIPIRVNKTWNVRWVLPLSLSRMPSQWASVLKDTPLPWVETGLTTVAFITSSLLPLLPPNLECLSPTILTTVLVVQLVVPHAWSKRKIFAPLIDQAANSLIWRWSLKTGMELPMKASHKRDAVSEKKKRRQRRCFCITLCSCTCRWCLDTFIILWWYIFWALLSCVF